MRLTRLITLAMVAACGGGDGEPDGGIDGDAGQPGDESAFVFDESQIRTFELTIAPADWEFLNDNAELEQYVPGSVSYAGSTLANIGVRYKGAVGSLALCFDEMGNRTCDKLSLKLKFNEYEPGQKLMGLKRINLHSMQSDPSKMHDALSYKLFRDANVYAPRTAYARLVVNGELLGLFAVVEAIDGRFTRRNFPDGGGGNLYKEVWPVHFTEQPYLASLKTNEDSMPSADKMLRFAAALDGASDSTIKSVLEQWTDTGMLMRHQAVARLIDHWDGIVAWYCIGGGDCFNHNYYWYESATEDKLWLVPWDVDHTFEEPSPVRTNYGMPDWDDTAASCAPIPIFLGISGRAPSCDTAILRPLATAFWDRYVVETQALLDGSFSALAMEARIDELESLLAEVIEEDPDVDSSDWASAVENLRSTVAAKRSYIQSKLL